MKRVLGTLAVLFTMAHSAAAQDARLAARLDPLTLAAVNAIVDSARADRLPTEPLRDRALEGAAKGSDGRIIVNAVRQLSARMASARRVLGAGITDEEIALAAGAFELGVSAHDLARLQAACGHRGVTMSLVVLADLIARDVPVPTATDLAIQLARAGVRNGDLSLFQRNVRADIGRGADPAAAATTRARGLVLAATPARRPE